MCACLELFLRLTDRTQTAHLITAICQAACRRILCSHQRHMAVKQPWWISLFSDQPTVLDVSGLVIPNFTTYVDVMYCIPTRYN